MSLKLVRTDTGTTAIEMLHAATTIWSRFVGLQFRSGLPNTHGLLIVPCSSIHTMFVRFALDVFFISKDGVVIEVRREVRPWKIALPKKKAHAVLETSAGAIELEAGTQVCIKSTTAKLPSSLRFLAGLEEMTC